jgi:hypothetical protein
MTTTMTTTTTTARTPCSPAQARTMRTTTLSSLQSLLKLQSKADDNNNDGKDAVVASASKNNDDHKVVLFAMVGFVVAAADEGRTRLRGRLPTLMPLHRRRGGDLLSLKLQSNNNDKGDEASIASASKNNKDHLRPLLGLQTTVESLARPEAMARQEAAP